MVTSSMFSLGQNLLALNYVQIGIGVSVLAAVIIFIVKRVNTVTTFMILIAVIVFVLQYNNLINAIPR